MTDQPAQATHRNRLADETSPYLLQHAANPVDWYPWGDEAFERAREQDKPILLSVGYSSCHWCHVMAHESFEDEATAALMNEGFISIKVDREERPDIDAVYMAATQALTGQGGWPMTVFITPDGKPFYAGTYFPPEDGPGRPGFPRLLESIRHAWDQERDKLLQSAETITARLREAAEHSSATTEDAAVASDAPARAIATIRGNFDRTHGGFAGAPKFPSPGNLEFLLAHHARALGDGQDEGRDGGEPSALDMVLHTLRQMARGGIYDQLGGGFARYSVDERWLVPHFEKMLYDNAQLVRTYLHAWQLTGEPLFERIVRETLDYLEREMLDGEGGLYSAQDADSEGVEGKFFLWSLDEVLETLGAADAQLFSELYGVTAQGNFADPHHPELSGRTVLSVAAEPATIAATHGIEAGDLPARIDAMRGRLFDVREQRVRPGLDDKVLASWNGLALAAFAEAARVMGDARYRAIAERNAVFVRERMWRDGRLLHSYKAGIAKVDGLAEDYAYYGLGLIELYRLTGDLAHLHWAVELFEALLARFRDDDSAGFTDAPSDGEKLLLRQRSFYDAATPSANGAAALLAVWLGRYLGRPEWERIGRETVAAAGEQMLQVPTGFGSLWQAVELLHSPHREVALVGAAAAREPLERELGRHFLPSTVIAPSQTGGGLPLLEQRDDGGSALAYVCEDMVCRLPVATAEELASQLQG
ncbi:MAG: thioredoxin domain-containing protein [Dehalococcoidia bacterium]